jgi:hypothetical protein
MKRRTPPKNTARETRMLRLAEDDAVERTYAAATAADVRAFRRRS